jgi:hypothetical protein
LCKQVRLFFPLLNKYWTEVTIYTRQKNGMWISSLVEQRANTFALASDTINVEDIYKDVIHE